MQMDEGRYITTGSFRTHYYEVGTGEPVILIHGGGAGADGWSNWMTGSADIFGQRMRAIVPDLVGFGRSDKPDPAAFTYDQDTRNQQLIDFIEALELERVNLIGNSMGGATALGVTMERPDLVANLVLMGSAGYSNTVSPELSTIVNYDFTPEGMRQVVSALTNPDYRASDAQIDYRYQASIDPATREAYAATMAWVRDVGMAYPHDEIAKIKTRTLVVNGKDDKVCPPDFAYGILQLIEDSTGIFLPRCGHWAMIEHPELFARLTLDFLLPSQDTAA
ncbi:alpha/beta hydrolase [Janibacter terrae]|uniref:alpha/beta fold hydrolase n=1 Tax=Janibacter TaxID=53457 RepID=UPI000B27976C|nr:alpha/beta hydrolase [Janibacter terrae]